MLGALCGALPGTGSGADCRAGGPDGDRAHPSSGFRATLSASRATRRDDPQAQHDRARQKAAEAASEEVAGMTIKCLRRADGFHEFMKTSLGDKTLAFAFTSSASVGRLAKGGIRLHEPLPLAIIAKGRGWLMMHSSFAETYSARYKVLVSIASAVRPCIGGLNREPFQIA